MADKAAHARLNYLKQQASIHGLPLEESWDEARIRQEFRKYNIPQSGIKKSGEKSNPPTKKMTVLKNQPQQLFDNSIGYKAQAATGSIENNVPFVNREQRDRLLEAQKPKLDPNLVAIQPGQSFQVQEPWTKGLAMKWASKAKKLREAKNLGKHVYDIRTGPCPRDPRYARVWRIV